jgi:hypothetical protein
MGKSTDIAAVKRALVYFLVTGPIGDKGNLSVKKTAAAGNGEHHLTAKSPGHLAVVVSAAPIPFSHQHLFLDRVEQAKLEFNITVTDHHAAGDQQFGTDDRPVTVADAGSGEFIVCGSSRKAAGSLMVKYPVKLR